MGFSLLDNPFAILSVGMDASPAQIMARARETGDDRAAAASRTLIAPRTRLAAEVGFLPGLTEEQLWACLGSLASKRTPNISSFPLLARANVLAHLAAVGKASADEVKALAGISAQTKGDTLAVLNRIRQAASMPPVPEAMLDSALEQLQIQHAEALADGARALSGGADALTEMVRSLGPTVTATSVFLRQAIAAWERATAGDDTREREKIQQLDGKLRQSPNDADVALLSQNIRSVANRLRPSLALSRHLGLPNDVTSTMVEPLCALALQLVDKHAAIRPAAAILETLAGEFGTEDQAGRRIAEHLADLRARIATGEDTPEQRRLAAALDDAEQHAELFKGNAVAGMNENPTGARPPPVVRELWYAFTAAATNATSALPWQALRSFAIRLHNDFSAADASLALTNLALRLARGNRAADDVRPQLEKDRRFLEREVLQRQLGAALEQRQKRSTVRRLISQLIPLIDEEEERQRYSNVLRQIQWQVTKQYLVRACYAAFAVFIVYMIVVNGNKNSRTTTANNTRNVPPPATTARTVPPPVAVPPPVVDRGLEERPPPGTAVLSRQQLRWCMFQDARLSAAHGYLEGLRASQYTNSDAFNRAVAAFNGWVGEFNASCREYRYQRSDKDVVDAELLAKAERVQTDGQLMVSEAYTTRSIARQQTPPPTAYPPAPRTSSPPASATPAPGATRTPAGSSPSNQVANVPAQAQPAVSTAYQDGQWDRRGWESWFAGQTGDAQRGAEWWAGVRSTTNPPACDKAPGLDRSAAMKGCLDAKARLTTPDRRRRAEADYKAGWNNP